jgi:hypothetical protein
VIGWLSAGVEAGVAMRGEDRQTAGMFSYVSCEGRVPGDHRLRAIRAIVEEALVVLSAPFERL